MASPCVGLLGTCETSWPKTDMLTCSCVHLLGAAHAPSTEDAKALNLGTAVLACWLEHAYTLAHHYPSPRALATSRMEHSSTPSKPVHQKA